MYSQPKRIEFLDSIRGLAALFVLLSHSLAAFSWPNSLFFKSLTWPFVDILWNGKEAVVMFFILSGYVLSKPYVETSPVTRTFFLPTFYFRRFIRIWPPWFFAFVASVMARKWSFFHPDSKPPVTSWFSSFWHKPLTTPDFLRQCVFTLHDPSRLLLNQDWSLGVELKASLLIPLFVVCARRKNQAWIFPLAVAFLFFSTGLFYVSMIIGVLVAQYDARWCACFASLPKLAKAGVFAGGLLFYQAFGLLQNIFTGQPSLYVYKYGLLLTALGCAAILIAVLGSKGLQRMLSWKPVVFLGRVSYSVYLLQFITIFCLLPPLVACLNRFGITQPLILFFMTILTSVVVTVGCAAVMHRLIEIPVIDFGHWITKRIQLT